MATPGPDTVCAPAASYSEVAAIGTTQNSFWAGLQIPLKNRSWGVCTLKVMLASPVTVKAARGA
jgi:hypothetical protein